MTSIFCAFVAILLFGNLFQTEQQYLIDCIRYINLDKRTDRRKSIENQISRLVDMNLVNAPKNISAFRFRAIEDENRALACTRSHIGVLKHFIETKCRNGVVFEDDWQFHNPGFSNQVQKKRIFDRIAMLSPPQNFDVVMFAANFNKRDSNKPRVDPRYNTTDFLRVSSALTASGYLVNGSYFSTLLKNFLECQHITKHSNKTCYIDLHWRRLMPIDQWFVFDNPKLGSQAPSYSDIQLKNVNYRV